MVSMVSISTTSPLEPVRPEGAQPTRLTTDVASASATVAVRPVRDSVKN
jgi:hypothetical protein